jgi:hypothetical protein
MNLHDLVLLYQESGFTINKFGANYYLNRGFINYSFPQLSDIQLDKSLLNLLKWKSILTVIQTDLRFRNTHEFILETDRYDIEGFNCKVRNRIRRSLRDCTFRRPSLADLLLNGLEINRQNEARHKTHHRMLTNKEKWARFITSFYTDEHVYILGAYINDEMIGYIMAYKYLGKYILVNPYFNYKACCSGPMNGLLYTLINKLIEKEGTIKISYGLESFVPLPRLNNFKYSMLFKRVPATRLLLINPLLLPFIKLIVFVNIVLLKHHNVKNSGTRQAILLYQGHRLLTKECRKIQKHRNLYEVLVTKQFGNRYQNQENFSN